MKMEGTYLEKHRQRSHRKEGEVCTAELRKSAELGELPKHKAIIIYFGSSVRSIQNLHYAFIKKGWAILGHLGGMTQHQMIKITM